MKMFSQEDWNEIMEMELNDTLVEGYNTADKYIQRRGLEWTTHQVVIRLRIYDMDDRFTIGMMMRIQEEI